MILAPNFSNNNLDSFCKGKIDRRVDAFFDFLRQNKISPSIITLARSRFSGYTPENDWEYIEKILLSKLNDVYDIKIRDYTKKFV